MEKIFSSSSWKVGLSYLREYSREPLSDENIDTNDTTKAPTSAPNALKYLKHKDLSLGLGLDNLFIRYYRFLVIPLILKNIWYCLMEILYSC